MEDLGFHKVQNLFQGPKKSHASPLSSWTLDRASLTQLTSRFPRCLAADIANSQAGHCFRFVHCGSSGSHYVDISMQPLLHRFRARIEYSVTDVGAVDKHSSIQGMVCPFEVTAAARMMYDLYSLSTSTTWTTEGNSCLLPFLTDIQVSQECLLLTSIYRQSSPYCRTGEFRVSRPLDSGQKLEKRLGWPWILSRRVSEPGR